jgi:hypothetical protein
MKISWLILAALVASPSATSDAQFHLLETDHDKALDGDNHAGPFCIRLPITNVDNEQCASIEFV